MTRAEIMEALDELGVEYNTRGRHSDLGAQLWAAVMTGVPGGDRR